MSYNLVIAETTAKVRTLGAALRSIKSEASWRTIPTSGFSMDWPKSGLGVNLDTLQPKFSVKNKPALNRIMAAVEEAAVVYLGMDDDQIGETASFHLKGQILERWPDKVIKRLRIREITTAALQEAVESNQDVIDKEAEARIACQVIDRLLSQMVGDLMGLSVGRAMAPAFNILVSKFGLENHKLLAADFTSGPFASDSIVFISDFIPSDSCNEVLTALMRNPPKKFDRVVDEDLVAHPPRPFSLEDLLTTATEYLGLKSIEVMTQANSLYESGYITRPVGAGFGLKKDFVTTVHTKITALVGKKFCGTYGVPEHLDRTEAVRPTDISCDPSTVPKPVRQLYRLIWARSLAACSIRATVRHERVSFKVGEIKFETEGLQVISSGYDRVGMGIFLRRQEVPDGAVFRKASLEAGWPTESEYLKALSSKLCLNNPASVVKALENNGFIQFEGRRITPTGYGRKMLRRVEFVMPELASPLFFSQFDYRMNQVAKGNFRRDVVVSEYHAWIEEKARRAAVL